MPEHDNYDTAGGVLRFLQGTFLQTRNGPAPREGGVT
jgi:hypothetical protein